MDDEIYCRKRDDKVVKWVDGKMNGCVVLMNEWMRWHTTVQLIDKIREYMS